MDWLSFGQAISDLNLELFLTSILVGILFGLGLFVGRWSLRRELNNVTYHQKDMARKTWWNNFWQGISTELFGAVITTIGFGLILVVFQQYQVVQSAKADLILQMGSPDNSFAIEAVRIARQKGWFSDGTLKKVSLYRANLEGANLAGVNLEGAILIEANLKGANLKGANLKGANLTGVSLEGAILTDANFRETNLYGANLKRADSNTNFQGATLPDNKQWVNFSDVDRFTDPDYFLYQPALEKVNELRADMGLEPIE